VSSFSLFIVTQVFGIEFVYETDNLAVRERRQKQRVFLFVAASIKWLDSFLFLFSLILLIQNIRKTPNDKSLKNQKKPGQSRKNQLLDPGDFFMRRKG
jgi:hypothetical protein